MGNMVIDDGFDYKSVTGFTPIPEARYHVLIIDVNDKREPNKNGKVSDILELEILAGEAPGQERKRVKLYLNLQLQNGAWVETDIHKRWAFAAGLFKASRSINFTPRMLAGRDVVVYLVQNGNFSNVGNYGADVWATDDIDVAGVPKGSLGGDNSIAI